MDEEIQKYILCTSDIQIWNEVISFQMFVSRRSLLVVQISFQMTISGSDILVSDLQIWNFVIWVMDMNIRKAKVVDIFFYATVPMDTVDSYMGISWEIDVWDRLDDVDMEQSIFYNALHNEHRAHERSEMFTTNEVR